MHINEKDSLSDILIQEKDIIKLYGTFLPEGSTPEIRSILKSNMETVSKQQFQVFEAMKTKGYYKIKDADQNEINQTKSTFQ